MEKYINKEQALMQLTGKFPKDMSIEKYIGLVNSRINELTATDVISVPEGVTNGNMIQAMFPNVIISESKDTVHLKYPTVNSDPLFFVQISKKWWDAPYKTDKEIKVPKQEPKSGHWIRTVDKTEHFVWECDKCEWQQRFATNYCPDCGATMETII